MLLSNNRDTRTERESVMDKQRLQPFVCEAWYFVYTQLLIVVRYQLYTKLIISNLILRYLLKARPDERVRTVHDVCFSRNVYRYSGFVGIDI